jgi:hypothetical protein
MTDSERDDNDKKVVQAIEMCCMGDKNAESMLRSFAFIARTIDDHVDGDAPADVVSAFAEATIMLQMNPFYIKHSSAVTAIWAAAFNAWIDSNDWMESGGLRRRHAMVIRDYINEMCQVVALIVGGWHHMRNVSLNVRELFLKDEE